MVRHFPRIRRIGTYCDFAWLDAETNPKRQRGRTLLLVPTSLSMSLGAIALADASGRFVAAKICEFVCLS